MPHDYKVIAIHAEVFQKHSRTGAETRLGEEVWYHAFKSIGDGRPRNYKAIGKPQKNLPEEFNEVVKCFQPE